MICLSWASSSSVSSQFCCGSIAIKPYKICPHVSDCPSLHSHDRAFLFIILWLLILVSTGHFIFLGFWETVLFLGRLMALFNQVFVSFWFFQTILLADFVAFCCSLCFPLSMYFFSLGPNDKEQNKRCIMLEFINYKLQVYYCLDLAADSTGVVLHQCSKLGRLL